MYLAFETTAELSPRKCSLETTASNKSSATDNSSDSNETTVSASKPAFFGLAGRRPAPMESISSDPDSPKVYGMPPGLGFSPDSAACVAQAKSAAGGGTVLSYGPHGSPRKAAQAPATTILSYGPHGSPQRARVMHRDGGAQSVTLRGKYAPAGYAYPGSAPGLAQPVQAHVQAHVQDVLSYVPAGIAAKGQPPPTAPALKLAPGMTPPKLAKPAAPESGVVLSYGPHGSPKKRHAISQVTAPAQPAVSMPARSICNVHGPPGLLSREAYVAAGHAPTRFRRPEPLASPMKKDVPMFLLTSP